MGEQTTLAAITCLTALLNYVMGVVKKALLVLVLYYCYLKFNNLRCLTYDAEKNKVIPGLRIEERS